MPRKLKSYKIAGQYFHDIHNMSACTGVSENTLRTRLSKYKRGVINERSVLKPVIYSNAPKRITILNKTFDSIAEASKYFDIQLAGHIKRHGEDWRAWPKPLINKLKTNAKTPYAAKHVRVHKSFKIGKNNAITLAGKHFNSITEAAKYCGITISAMTSRIDKYGVDNPRVLKISEPVYIDKRRIASITRWAHQHHVTYEHVYEYCILKHHTHTTTNEILNYVKSTYYTTKCAVTVRGQFYNNLTDLAKAYNLNPSTVQMRYRHQYLTQQITADDLVQPVNSYHTTPFKIFDHAFKTRTEASNYYHLNVYNYTYRYGRDSTKWPDPILRRFKKKEELLYDKKE